MVPTVLIKFLCDLSTTFKLVHKAKLPRHFQYALIMCQPCMTSMQRKLQSVCKLIHLFVPLPLQFHDCLMKKNRPKWMQQEVRMPAQVESQLSKPARN